MLVQGLQHVATMANHCDRRKPVGMLWRPSGSLWEHGENPKQEGEGLLWSRGHGNKWGVRESSRNALAINFGLCWVTRC